VGDVSGVVWEGDGKGSAEALDILCGGGSGLDGGEEKVDIRGWAVVKR